MDIFQNKVSEHDWPEHFSHENGNYNCHCHNCKNKFVAHKRTVQCKKCFIEQQKDRIVELEQQASQDREALANWIMSFGFSTGHGDNIPDLIKEADWQFKQRSIDDLCV